jgi:hypothetical protein
MKLSKAKRVKAEAERLYQLLAEVPETKKAIVDGLVQMAADQRARLDDLQADLDENGYTEMFQQGKDNPPYERKRPTSDLYTTICTSYQKTIKQLTDLLPKDAPKKAEDDGFDAFLIRNE